MNYYKIRGSLYVKGKSRHAVLDYSIPRGVSMGDENCFSSKDQAFPRNVFFPTFQQINGSLADVIFPVVFASTRLFICNDGFYDFLSKFDLDKNHPYSTSIKVKDGKGILDYRIIHFWRNIEDHHLFLKDSCFSLIEDKNKTPVQFSDLSKVISYSCLVNYWPVHLKFDKLYDVFYSYTLISLCCSQTFKDAYEASGLTGLDFLPVPCVIETSM